MHLLYAPPKKFGHFPPGAAPLFHQVKFFSNVALCPKFYWAKQHSLQGFVDLTPRWMQKLRSSRTLHKILFIASGGFGDSMWTMPVIRRLRDMHPRAQIFVATTPRVSSIFQNFPYADACVSNEYHSLQNLIEIADEVYDCGGIATFLQKEMLMEPVDACFKHLELKPYSSASEMRPHLVLTLEEGKQAEALLKRKGIDPSRDVIVTISSESSTPNRNWPASYLYELASSLSRQLIRCVILAESPMWRDQSSARCPCGFDFTFSTRNPPAALAFQCPVCKAFTKIDSFGPPPGVIDLTGDTTYRMALAIIAQSNAFVGPASSLVIASTALEVPTLGLYGAFHPKRLLKYYEKFAFLYGKMDCSPCSEHWTECRHGYPAPCMRSIFPSTVFDAVMKLLEKYPRVPISKAPLE